MLLTFGKSQMCVQFPKAKTFHFFLITGWTLSLVTLIRPLKNCIQVLVYHLHDNDVLTPLQSGFIPVDSTVNKLIFLNDTFSKALNSGKEVRVVVCDISKAFDRVWHAGLIHRLRKSFHKIWQLLTENTCQRFVIPGAKSDRNYIRADKDCNWCN